MKKQLKAIILSALALILVTGCSSVKDDYGTNVPDVQEKSLALQLKIDGMSSSSSHSQNAFKPETRAGMEAINNTKIRDVKVYFNPTNSIDDKVYQATKISLKEDRVLIGLDDFLEEIIAEGVNVYVIANAPSDRVFDTQTELNNFVLKSNFNEDNPELFVMTGSVHDFKFEDYGRLATINLTRIASKFHFNVEFDKGNFTLYPDEAKDKHFISEVKARFVNFNNHTLLFPQNRREVIKEGRRTSKFFELTRIVDNDMVGSHYSYSLGHELYSYINSWTKANVDSDGTYFDIEVTTEHRGVSHISEYRVTLKQKDAFTGYDLDINRSYTVTAQINKSSQNGSDVNSDLGIEDWNDENVVSDTEKLNFIYIKDSNREIVTINDSEKIALDVVLGKNNARNTLSIENLKVVSYDHYFNFKEANGLEMNRFNINKLRRKIVYVYEDHTTVSKRPKYYTLENSTEEIPVEYKDITNPVELDVKIVGTEERRVIRFTSEAPRLFLDKIITFDVVDRVTKLRKSVQITQKAAHTLTVDYPFLSGTVPLVLQPHWKDFKQMIRQIVPGSYDLIEGLVNRNTEDRDIERFGVVTVRTNVDKLGSNSIRRTPTQVMTTNNFNVILTGFKFTQIFDPLGLGNYKQYIVDDKDSKNEISVSPNFMVGSKSSHLRYINRQQAEIHCHLYWESVKDPITGQTITYKNFRLPTTAELKAIVDIENSDQFGGRSILDSTLGFKLLLPVAKQEHLYWSSEGLAEVKHDKNTTIYQTAKQFIADTMKIAKVRCVRDVPSI